MDPKRVPLVIMLLAGLVGWMLWSGDGLTLLGINGIEARRAEVASMRDSLTTLVAQTDSVKDLVASGRIEELRQRVEGYRNALEVMRRFVPEQNEVPDLIDAINTRAKIRGVTLANLEPDPVESGPPPYDTYAYTMAVIGRYDQVGSFLADIASLQRIIVPQELRLGSAASQAAAVLGDTSKAMLEASFKVKTFVKSTGGGTP